MENVKSGNLDELYPERGGWRIAAFIDAESPFHNHDFEIKWSLHPEPHGNEKISPPVVDAKMLTVLIEGEFEITIPSTGQSFPLKKPGDYVFIAEGIPHSWKCLKNPTRMLTIRWPSLVRK